MKRLRRSWSGAILGFSLLLLAACHDEIREEEDVEAAAEPTIEELGLRLAAALGAGLDLTGLSQAEIDRVARGSYLVNGASICNTCHTTSAGYLAGGAQFPLPFPDVQGLTSVVSRNLTPDPTTGLQLTEEQFIEALRTGKDFTDSTAATPQQMIVMPWHVFRFMSRDDLSAIYAFLRRIRPVTNQVRQTFTPPFPFPPVPFPPLGDGDPVNDPNNAMRGGGILLFFSAGPEHESFVTQVANAISALPASQLLKVGRGSYLVNALADCNSCHTEPFGGLIAGTVNVNTARYLAGGVNLGAFFGFDLFSRNLTPDPTTGLFLTEEQFIQTLRFGADFRRPFASLRIEPHFPTKFVFTLDDLKAIYAYLRVIPPVQNSVTIVP
ncbi:MAG: hypothetical protein HY726_20835 [Candidatus Rokubacteria bacterium]|nr:hypothetical protein [Candidatus Rokubacteria bacterium]